MVVLRRSVRLAAQSYQSVRKKAKSSSTNEQAASSSEKTPSTSSSSSQKQTPSKWKHGTLDRGMEHALYAKGFKYVVEVDEAGRGPLAGPVVAV